jgi:hypothetical protein
VLILGAGTGTGNGAVSFKTPGIRTSIHNTGTNDCVLLQSGAAVLRHEQLPAVRGQATAGADHRQDQLAAISERILDKKSINHAPTTSSSSSKIIVIQ